MRIGIVGKPNVGKSTFFAAATATNVEIANYPFCTIEPNVGIAFIPAPNPCPCQELRSKKESEGRLDVEDPNSRKGSICYPRTGSCEMNIRLVPTTLVDVAGLVPGAHEGKGRGNEFLNDLAQCDALIQVVDIAGTTDIEGNPIGNDTDLATAISSAIEEHNFLLEELDAWIAGIIVDGWSRGARRVQAEGESGLLSYLSDRLTGIGGKPKDVSQAMNKFSQQSKNLPQYWDWEQRELITFASYLRREMFPVFVAANKADLVTEEYWVDLKNKVKSEGGLLIPTSADSELALRRASKTRLIDYQLGNSSFSITNEGESKLSAAQKKGLQTLNSRLNEMQSTGVTELLIRVVFDLLGQMVVYPVQDELHGIDGDQKILPDALIVPIGTNAKEMAFAVHTDLGNGFIRATDARTGRTIGSEHELSDNDVIKIHAKQ